MLLGSTALFVLLGCGDAAEPPRVQLSLRVDGTGLVGARTNLGYTIEPTEARIAIEDVELTIAGEAHTASVWRRAAGLVVPAAHAHPGHFQGGDVTGELRGRFLVDWTGNDGGKIGIATLLAGSYKSTDFTFSRATDADGLASADPLVGHTALLRGTATKDGVSTAFVAIIDSPEGRRLAGAPFDLEVGEGTACDLGFRLLTVDPHEGDTLFDGIDFAGLDTDRDGEVHLAPDATEASSNEAYNTLRRTLQRHDHFEIRALTEERP